jgi:hypothetical protein
MSAQVVTGQLTFNFQATQVDSSGLVNPITASGGIQYPSSLGNFLNATGAANSIDTLYSAQLTMAGAATHVNLHAATDILGNAVVFARVRGWAVYVTTLTAAFLLNVYTRTGTDPLVWLPVTTSGALWVPPGGLGCVTDPISTSTNGFVVSSTSYDFTLDPGANTVVANVLIIGNSAA